MLKPLGFLAAQACWSRPVLPPPMIFLVYVFQIRRPSALSCRSWEVLVDFSDLATVELDLCRSILEISRHPLRSRLKGVSWLDQSTSGCLSDFTSLPPMHRAYSALLL
ncbi:hypothetical protein SLEP1_g19748 [Rubroshorea leprosula]|uniref:Secreted protein n=1 Tax=Rubroshorea leprosula TaxID=152421 RepID=A0AAV5J9M6_9ROSI|nr:hypothetical protein SLEP1_g19748 [Rubroshorea leprosula]